jgi:membrane-associated phospholipid phosphatase
MDGLFNCLQDVTARRRLTLSLVWLGLVTGAISPFLIPCDLAIARWIVRDGVPGDLRKAIELSEIFGHGVGVAMLLGVFAVLAPNRLWALPRLATFAFGAGAIATIMKLFVIRSRPYRFDLDTVTSSVVGQWTWDWSLQHVAVYDAGWRSFPSGHAATAFGLAFGMSLLVPRGKYLFSGFAAMAMMQRISGQAHYASDVMAGVAIGCFWCLICISPRLLGGLFEQLEPSQNDEKSAVRSPAADAAVPELLGAGLAGPHFSAANLSASSAPTATPAAETPGPTSGRKAA